MQFLEGVMDVMDFAKENSLALTSGSGEHFTVETLYDPCMLLKLQLRLLINVDKPVQRIMLHFKKDSSCAQSADTFMLAHPQELHVFQRAKYDALRRHLRYVYFSCQRAPWRRIMPFQRVAVTC